jgi:hypothetical protein
LEIFLLENMRKIVNFYVLKIQPCQLCRKLYRSNSFQDNRHFFSPKIGQNRHKLVKIAKNRSKSPKIITLSPPPAADERRIQAQNVRRGRDGEEVRRPADRRQPDRGTGKGGTRKAAASAIPPTGETPFENNNNIFFCPPSQIATSIEEGQIWADAAFYFMPDV